MRWNLVTNLGSNGGLLLWRSLRLGHTNWLGSLGCSCGLLRTTLCAGVRGSLLLGDDWLWDRVEDSWSRVACGDVQYSFAR